ncbi:MAG: leucyl aminopeptidase family protein [Gammaproteobacteria bacterium]|nr:MAG: leucyl aminopeptidase family protein [Gammaproteobacteria bacterium]
MMFDLLSWAKKVVKQAKSSRSKGPILVQLMSENATCQERVVRALVAAAAAWVGPMPDYRKKPARQDRTIALSFYGLQQKIDLSIELAAGQGNNLARFLTAQPANYLTPALYRKAVTTLSRAYGWKMQFLDVAALQKKKAGAFLAVCQGSATRDAGIVHLSYRPSRPRQRGAKRLALVGKGICFDTGGTNLKPARHMVDMHEDMEGSAVALGTLLALTELEYPHPIDCWLALAQNHIGPLAYKQSDVVHAMNGLGIEVVHTDAEGRMVLADTLTLASHNKPDLIIDYATLTGSCVHALGTTYSGVFTNRESWLPDLIEAGQDSGERVWPFPMDKNFDRTLESQVADLKQCTLDGEADHILAARFLSHFIGKCQWVHVDLSAGKHKGGLAHIPTDITGFGVRFTLDLLLNKKILQH